MFTKSSFDGRNDLKDFHPPRGGEFENLLLPISPKEVKTSELDYSSAAGPDGLNSSYSCKIPIRVICKVFTLWMTLGWVPLCVLDSRTIQG